MTPAMILAAAYAPSHPSLTWTPIHANAEDARQHRRNHNGSGTMCGIVGVVTLAESTDPRCEDGCWS